MKYIVSRRYLLCGYKLAPFGLYDIEKRHTLFFPKDIYELILKSDGTFDLDSATFTKEQQDWFSNALNDGMILEAKNGEKLHPLQEYAFFDNRFKDEVQISVTGDCNYRCKHCFMSAPDAKYGIPSKEDLFNWIEQLASCGIRRAHVTGGEPLIRSDFVELLDHMLIFGIEPVTIYTNGALINQQLLDDIKALDIRPTFQLSFDGIGYHDWLRGIPGAEQKVYDALNLLRENRFPASCTMCLHRNNKDSIRETVNTLASLGCNSIKFGRAADLGCWNTYGNFTLTMDECMQIYLDYLKQFREDHYPMSIQMEGVFQYDSDGKVSYVGCDKCWKQDHVSLEDVKNQFLCTPLRTGMYLSPEGKVLPCMSMIGTPIADKYPGLRELPLHDILNGTYYTETMLYKVHDYMDHNEKCRKCKYAVKCFGGCRAVAVRTGTTDFLAIDPDICDFYLHGWYEKFEQICDECNLENGVISAAPGQAEDQN